MIITKIPYISDNGKEHIYNDGVLIIIIIIIIIIINITTTIFFIIIIQWPNQIQNNTIISLGKFMWHDKCIFIRWNTFVLCLYN